MDNNDKTFLDKESGIIFSWQADIDAFEPIGYDAYFNQEGELCAKDIEKDSIFYDFILFARYDGSRMSKKTGKIISEYLEVYQWNIIFECLKSVIAQRSDDYLCAISRQSKHSWTV